MVTTAGAVDRSMGAFGLRFSVQCNVLLAQQMARVPHGDYKCDRRTKGQHHTSTSTESSKTRVISNAYSSSSRARFCIDAEATMGREQGVSAVDRADGRTALFTVSVVTAGFRREVLY